MVADTLIKLGTVLFPFIREMLFGGDSVTDVIRKHKLASLLFIANIILFILLGFMTVEAYQKHWEAEEEREVVEELREKIEQMLPAGVDGTDTIINIAQRITKLQEDRDFYAERLSEAYGELEAASVQLTEVLRTCRPTDLGAQPEPVPKRPSNNDDGEDLRAMLNRLKEEGE